MAVISKIKKWNSKWWFFDKLFLLFTELKYKITNIWIIYGFKLQKLIIRSLICYVFWWFKHKNLIINEWCLFIIKIILSNVK